MGYELTDFEPGLILKGNGFSNELRAGGRSVVNSKVALISHNYSCFVITFEKIISISNKFLKESFLKIIRK
jgi:hypothetical protein